jgi:hypothetical protein
MRSLPTRTVVRPDRTRCLPPSGRSFPTHHRPGGWPLRVRWAGRGHVFGLLRGLGRFILAVQLRKVREVKAEVLTRPGHYKPVADNLQVKEEVSGANATCCASIPTKLSAFIANRCWLNLVSRPAKRSNALQRPHAIRIRPSKSRKTIHLKSDPSKPPDALNRKTPLPRAL